MEKGDRGHRSQLPLDWRYGSQMDSFCPAPWEQAPNSQMGFYESDAPRADVGSNPAFMDMALMAGHFALNPPFDPYSDFSRLQHQRNGVGIGDGPSDSRASSGGQGVQESGNLQRMGVSGNESSDTKPSGEGEEEPSSNALTAKKRKMSVQESGRTQLKEEGEAAARDGDGSKQNAEQGSVTVAAVKLNGKRGNEKTDPPKEDYIHVRARRGQATNSHSLAERVRREKISERMKLLQDLVPGCSKVTGKAVMLDEIINYVQSLQRQVEFLSMKLAAINPQLNFGIEGLLSKEILQSQAGPSTAGFSSDIVHPLLHQNLQELVQSRSFGMAAPVDLLRVPVNAQMSSSMSMLKESKPQMPMTWNEELHSRMQMDFVGSQSLNNIQDLNSKNRDGFSM